MKIQMGEMVFEGSFDDYVSFCKYNNVEPKSEHEPLKVGDYAKVVGNKHKSYFGGKDGEIVILLDQGTSIKTRFRCERIDGYTFGGNYWADVDNGEIVRAAPEEVAEAKSKLEEEKRQAEEAEKWAKIGRKVGEFKVGDITQHVRSIAKYGTSVVTEIDGDFIRVKFADYSGLGICRDLKKDHILVAPVDSVVNLSVSK